MTTKKWIAMFYAIYIYFTKKLIQMTAVSVAESELAVSVSLRLYVVNMRAGIVLGSIQHQSN